MNDRIEKLAKEYAKRKIDAIVAESKDHPGALVRVAMTMGHLLADAFRAGAVAGFAERSTTRSPEEPNGTAS